MPLLARRSGRSHVVGHLDVVPVTGRDWQTDPFVATERDGRIFGRGTSDMKGFAAAAIRAMAEAASRPLVQPLKLALSYDEEAGCVEISDMIGSLDRTIGRPDLCIVGEPTSMQILAGHKGKVSLRVVFTGSSGHSAAARNHVNALHLACDFIGELRRLQDEIALFGLNAEGYGVPYSTIHVGSLAGGSALNIIPQSATLEFEIRYLAGEDIEGLSSKINVVRPRSCCGRVRTSRKRISSYQSSTGIRASILPSGWKLNFFESLADTCR